MATLTTANGNATVKFEYTTTTAKMTSVLGDVAENLWKEEQDEDGVVTNPFENASVQEKLDVVDAHVKSVIINMANSFKSAKAQLAARETESASEHEL